MKRVSDFTEFADRKLSLLADRLCGNLSLLDEHCLVFLVADRLEGLHLSLVEGELSFRVAEAADAVEDSRSLDALREAAQDAEAVFVIVSVD